MGHTQSELLIRNVAREVPDRVAVRQAVGVIDDGAGEMGKYGRKDFLRDEFGSVAVWAGLGLVAIMGLAGLAVDTGYLYMQQNRLQVAADAATMAAVSQLPDQTAARNAALDYAEKNLPAAANGTVLAAADVVMGRWDEATRAFTAGGSPVNAVQATTRATFRISKAEVKQYGQTRHLQNVDLAGSSGISLLFLTEH